MGNPPIRSCKECRSKLIGLLHQVSGRHDLSQVFSDFLFIVAATISDSVDRSQAKEREIEYDRIIRRYSKEEQQLFSKMFAALVGELERHAKEEHFVDVLGEVFHELGLHNKWKGQFFTPQAIADMVGSVVCDWTAVKHGIDVYGYASLMEPAAGSGVMCLGFLNGFYEQARQWSAIHPNHSQQIYMQVCDIDERCCWMAYIQLGLYGVPAVICQQNSLSMEIVGCWYTPVYIIDGWQWKKHHAEVVLQSEKEVISILNT